MTEKQKKLKSEGNELANIAKNYPTFISPCPFRNFLCNLEIVCQINEQNMLEFTLSFEENEFKHNPKLKSTQNLLNFTLWILNLPDNVFSIKSDDFSLQSGEGQVLVMTVKEVILPNICKAYADYLED